jgi:hypothetical protein
LGLVVQVAVVVLAQHPHKMEIIQYLAQLRLQEEAVALMRPTPVEMVDQVVAVAVVALLLVLAAQATPQAHHLAKVVAVELRLLTTPHHLLVLVVAAVLVGQQHQMGQVHQVQRLVMEQMEQRLPFLVHL